MNSQRAKRLGDKQAERDTDTKTDCEINRQTNFQENNQTDQPSRKKCFYEALVGIDANDHP